VSIETEQGVSKISAGVENIRGAFDEHPAFYAQDNRRHRAFNPVTKSFLELKYHALLPRELIQGKHILDLGSCTGAAGQWALYYGAESYTGVEVQEAYVAQSRQLLAHWGSQVCIVRQDVRSFLSDAHPRQFDIVLAAGMLYHFIDTKLIIDLMCNVARDVVIIETNYPPAIREGKIPRGLAVTEYMLDQEVNLAQQKASLLGVSATSSLAALDIFFKLNGYQKREETLEFEITPDTVLYDERLVGNSPLQLRFAVRYFRDPSGVQVKTLEESLPSQQGAKRSWEYDEFAKKKTAAYAQHAAAIRAEKQGSWSFNSAIASQFDRIAAREIPDYQRVIDRCVHIVRRLGKANPRVIDVGSAIGATLKALYDAGFTNIYGVDNSQAMLDKSFNKATLILSDKFPVAYGPYDVVIANWVLHFIRDRAAYLSDIRAAMSPGGILLLTEKVSSSKFAHELYYDFKRANGVTEEEIAMKREQIKGVLTTYDLTWYIDKLHELGYTHIDIVNANTVFVTIMAQLEDH